MSMENDFIKVDVNQSKNKKISIRDISPINDSSIKVVRQKERPPTPDSLSSEDSSYSEISSEPQQRVKKTKKKKILVKKTPQNLDYSDFINPRKVKQRDPDESSDDLV